jgi:hypothetical protein
MSAEKKHRTADEILQYLRGELSHREQHALERKLETDPFEKEALEGLEKLEPGMAEEDILFLHGRLRKRLARRRRITYLSAAATVASLLIIGSVFIRVHDFNPRPEEGTLSEKELPFEAPEMKETEEPLPDAGNQMAGVPAAEEISIGPSSKKGSREAAPERAVEDLRSEPIAPAGEAVVTVEATPVEPRPEAASVEAAPVEAAPVEAAPVEAAPRETAPRETAKGGATRKRMVSQDKPADLVSGQVTGVVIPAEDMESDVSSMDEIMLMGHPDGTTSGAKASVPSLSPDAEEHRGSSTLAYPEPGYEAFEAYIKRNIRFPAEDTSTLRAVVVLKFTVTADGAISDILPLRSPGPDFTEEAVRLLNEGPPWVPATDTSGATDELVRLRIVFKR